MSRMRMTQSGHRTRLRLQTYWSDKLLPRNMTANPISLKTCPAANWPVTPRHAHADLVRLLLLTLLQLGESTVASFQGQAAFLLSAIDRVDHEAVAKHVPSGLVRLYSL